MCATRWTPEPTNSLPSRWTATSSRCAWWWPSACSPYALVSSSSRRVDLLAPGGVACGGMSTSTQAVESELIDSVGERVRERVAPGEVEEAEAFVRAYYKG